MEPFQWDLRGASDAGPSADAIFQGGADAEMFAAQMAQAPGQAIERGAQTLFGIVQARQQVAQQLAMEMQLAERQHAMRRDLSTMEFRQQLARDSMQDAHAMERMLVGAQKDMERAQFSLQKEQEKQQQEQQAKDKLAGGQKYVEDLFGGALEMSTTPFEAMNYTDQSVQDMLGPNVDTSPLKAPFKGKYIPPEMQAAAVRALADAGEKNPSAYVAQVMERLGAYKSEQDFKDAATSRAKTMVGQVQSKPREAAGDELFKPGLPLAKGRTLSQATPDEIARIKDYAEGEFNADQEVRAITAKINDPNKMIFVEDKDAAVQAANARLEQIRAEKFQRGVELAGFRPETEPAQAAAQSQASPLQAAAEAMVAGKTEAEVGQILQAAGLKPWELTDEQRAEILRLVSELDQE